MSTEGKAEVAEKLEKPEVSDQKQKNEGKQEPEAKAAPAGPSMMDTVKKQLAENVFLQHILIVPVVILLTYFIGGIITWTVFLAVTITLSIRSIKQQKQSVYDKFLESLDDDNIDDVQEVAWLNQIVTKYWISCVPALVKPHIDGVSKTLSDSKPSFMHKLEIGKWSFGKKGPRFSQIRTSKEPDTSKYVLDGELTFCPDFSLELRIEPVKFAVVKILLTNVVFKGRLRIRFNLNEEVPNASIVSVCFVGDPLIEFSIKPMGSVDMLSLPKLYDWLNDTIMGAIKPLMVWPQKLQFTLGQGEVISEHTIEEPITEIAIIDRDELSEPPGYLILEKALNSTLPANINLGNPHPARELYLTYRRDPKGVPISALAVVCPSQGDEIPAGFTMIEKTPNGLSANLNAGTKGPETFLCYSKQEGPPITGLGLMNISVPVVYDNSYTRLDISPSGKISNLNSGSKGNPSFICYRGGCKSFSGYPLEMKDPNRGLLRIGLIEGSDLVAADVCGTSDPYCVFTIGDPTAKKLPKQKSSVIPYTLNPVWNESFVSEANTTDILTINVYDKDAVGSDDFLGRIQLPLDTLMCGKTVEQWIPLQLINKGFLHVTITALNFGLPPEDEVKALVPLECQESGGVLSMLGAKKRLGLSSTNIVRREARPIKLVKQEIIARPIGTEYVSKSGHVEKLPTKNVLVGISQGWQRRWFVLKEHKLLYYRSSKDSADHTLGSVGLKKATITTEENVNEYIFRVVTKAKTLECKVQTEEEFSEWYSAIATNIAMSDKIKGRFEVSEAAEDNVLSDDDLDTAAE
eukprot:CAMPEP_0117029572 /NCGR_PEP_ID=MMETSP0472-20121206/21401_1 /TAXON_ID=693140 ORGANISM="Tiarina fusus, Strain LIS" /NCGR_SAMPLE_ID=MMETSP0472 /ASSEMBLY_ACC=CAM_ASM_000603 /LENGTH=802 /DNA_ID=CAMNT_0004737373 /DNA_START=45 /DNA_END=2453 /DNA_ORIENTATION=+